jgi:hypothetical protein
LIDRRALLTDLQKLLRQLEADLLERTSSVEVPEVGRKLREEFAAAQSAQRTAQNFDDWRSDAITQVAAAWVLSCVFVRFLEDNQLAPVPKLAGPGEGLKRARDERELFFRAHPTLTDRDYLFAVFDNLTSHAATEEIFGEHNPIRDLPNWLSGDAAGVLIAVFQKIDANTGNLVHDFTDPEWDTRFLGDLYQDLSEAARKKYALLQTPVFVEEFILDRTLDPAIEEFGLAKPGYENRLLLDGRLHPDDRFKMIDPACGSGHFLLGSFARLVDRWRRKEPGSKNPVLVQRALDSVHGVDLNPYAVAIARFRLLLAALRECGTSRLSDAPGFEIHLACGDSLLHGSVRAVQQMFDETDELKHVYQPEDPEALGRILQPGRYHAVVANPPYITPKDRALSQAYRERYRTCHMKYSLAVPFMERIVSLAVGGGFTGQVTANSFMKREFGEKLIEEFFPLVDLTHVIDTSGAYIPGHGTPTAILFVRNRDPIGSTLRAVLGIRGELTTPEEPARGLVWAAIAAQVDEPGSKSEFVSVTDAPRQLFHKHPWSVGGGGASELKERLQQSSSKTLDQMAESVGFLAITGEDDVFVLPRNQLNRLRLVTRAFCTGDMVRDWTDETPEVAVFPYDARRDSIPAFELASVPQLARYLWPHRSVLMSRSMFGKSIEEHGFLWFEYMQFIRDRAKARCLIAFACVATQNHFVLDRGGRLFNRHAPVVKLPFSATEDEHLGLLGLLNSSSACFWMKQVFFDRGGGGIGGGIATEGWERFYEHDGTKLKRFPIAIESPLNRAGSLDTLARELANCGPVAMLQGWRPSGGAFGGTVRDRSAIYAQRWRSLREQMIALQEELDWQCYRLYGLLADQAEVEATEMQPPALALGQRAFEIVLARKVAAGEEQTTWFERHGSTPITEIPSDWPEWYRKIVERRIELIETNPNIALIERPEYKRRWNTEPWESQLERALREWLLDRLEGYFDFDGRMSGEPDGDSAPVAGDPPSGPLGNVPPQAYQPDAPARGIHQAPAPATDPSLALRVGMGPSSGPAGHLLPGGAKGAQPRPLPGALPIALISVAKVADTARKDADFLQVGELYRDDPAFDVSGLVAELVEAESVPLLPVLRYKASGLRKRVEWEKTWDLQRQEDAALSVVSGPLSVAGKTAQTSGAPGAEGPAPDAPPSSSTSDIRDAIHAPRTTDHGRIPVPPKYKSEDFQKSDFWRLRGKLDVPKERWVSFPHCEGEDGTLMIAWAGYDHLQLARAISAHYVDVQERLGGRDDRRLVPLLACVLELLPWLKQWHNEIDPEFGVPMGDYFEGFLQEESRNLGLTLEQIKAWQPPKSKFGASRKTRK